ncbi:hypothetical protein [Chitinophaga niabensis]|uniref:hypothetical protein n=1 Tax=Chitinophaga niabensis TaxID=536979 RepID=UPI001160F0CA|nr:hypothetical protein [Chitinophaga niabensis]
MKNSVVSKITYTLESCHNPNAPFRLRDWQVEYELLCEDEMRTLARAFGFNKNSVEKLVTGPKKFRYIKKKGYEISKVLHQESVGCRSFMDKRQPAHIQMQELLKRSANAPSKK